MRSNIKCPYHKFYHYTAALSHNLEYTLFTLKYAFEFLVTLPLGNIWQIRINWLNFAFAKSSMKILLPINLVKHEFIW